MTAASAGAALKQSYWPTMPNRLAQETSPYLQQHDEGEPRAAPAEPLEIVEGVGLKAFSA